MYKSALFESQRLCIQIFEICFFFRNLGPSNYPQTKYGCATNREIRVYLKVKRGNEVWMKTQESQHVRTISNSNLMCLYIHSLRMSQPKSQIHTIKTHDVCNLPMWCKTVVDSRSSMSGICTRICIFNYKANIYPKKHQRLPTYITQIVYSHTIYSRNISIIHICQYSHWLCLKMRYPKTVCLWFETLFTIVLFSPL